MLRHILLVDRDPNARLAMSIALRHAGYRVSSALDEEEALSLVTVPDGERPAFNLLIIDTELKGAPGRRLTDALNHFSPAIPSLMVSNFSDKAFFIDLLSHGHKGFIENVCCKDEALMRISNIRCKYTGKRSQHEKG
jgi:DNA-binding NarL/FixJ family response regulator